MQQKTGNVYTLMSKINHKILVVDEVVLADFIKVEVRKKNLFTVFDW